MRFIGRQELLLKLLANLFAKEINSKPANLPLAICHVAMSSYICAFWHATNEKKALLGSPLLAVFTRRFKGPEALTLGGS